jgi:hypothetical protein
MIRLLALLLAPCKDRSLPHRLCSCMKLNAHTRNHIYAAPVDSQSSSTLSAGNIGMVVTREHVRHNKSGITHRDRVKINHLRELPYQVKPLRSGGQVTLPSRTGEPQVYLWSAGCR